MAPPAQLAEEGLSRGGGTGMQGRVPEGGAGTCELPVTVRRKRWWGRGRGTPEREHHPRSGTTTCGHGSWRRVVAPKRCSAAAIPNLTHQQKSRACLVMVFIFKDLMTLRAAVLPSTRAATGQGTSQLPQPLPGAALGLTSSPTYERGKAAKSGVHLPRRNVVKTGNLLG